MNKQQLEQLMPINQLGHMKFKRALNPSECKIIQDIQLINTIELSEWWFAQGQFAYENCNLIFQVCEQITAERIDFYDNFRPTIIKQISHIKFPNLIFLQLNSNSIESIQCLQHLIAPNLQILSLNENNITNWRSLRKCNFPKLTLLNISCNPIIQVNIFAQCEWSNELSLAIYSEERKPIIDNIYSIFKLKGSRSYKKYLIELFL